MEKWCLKVNFNEKIELIARKNELPYLDVIVYKGYDKILRYASDGITGRERLQMYSMSKIFTVVSIMQLIEQGKISLDDKVEKFFPCFSDTYYKHNDKLVKNTVPITIKHLLMMTSGLSYDLTSPHIKEVQRKKGKSAKLIDFIPAFAKQELLFEPGTSFEYGLSHDVLAGITEVVSGLSFDKYVDEKIFKPLDINEATFRNEKDNLYQKFECNEDLSVTLASNENDFLLSADYISGGAGLICSIKEFAKIVKAFSNNGVAENGFRLLQPETIDKMIKEPSSHDFVKHCFNWQGDEYGYGLGVRVREKDNEWGLKKGEFGWDGACGSFWLSDRENALSIVVGMNVLSWELKYMGIHSEIVKEIYSELF